MTTYISVDVETSGLNPFVPDHQLLSVGAVAVTSDGLIIDTWYERITDAGTWDEATRQWWEQQNATARRDIFDITGIDSRAAALAFVDWIADTAERAVFVANPATFDHAWILRWLTEHAMPMPFDYRTLCLRSADWGRNPSDWGDERNGHRPVVPHHALHDAQAQAFDLIDLLVALER